MDIKALIKEAAMKNGMDMCGIASVDRFAGSPKGRHPTETLPGCKSVIAIGVSLLDGIVQANFRTFENGRNDLKGLYGTYGYTMIPNFELTYACYAVAKVIERQLGEVATPCSTGPMTNGMQISIRHAAVAAGLGEFGWAGIVVTPEFGPRNRFGVILTTAEIEPDPMIDAGTLCDPTKCSICTDCCPTKAIGFYGTDDTSTSTLGDKTYTYGFVSMPRCQAPTQGMKKKFGGWDDYLDTDEPTFDDIRAGVAKMPPSMGGLQSLETWHCGKCLSYCPIGKWKERFLDKELSGGLQNTRWGFDD
ncbi:MAG: hypothetical protein FWH33_04680 [Oscillospiraceae bacterium]|nr:hypothetical protein [Oscillospiraceae bacterium]